MNVVDLHEEPPLNDIPGRLRCLAESIESGEVEDLEAVFIVMVKRTTFTPDIAAFGDNYSRHTIAGVFQHCANIFLTD